MIYTDYKGPVCPYLVRTARISKNLSVSGTVFRGKKACKKRLKALLNAAGHAKEIWVPLSGESKSFQ